MTTLNPTAPYALGPLDGVTDLWWPFGPETGRYTFKTTAAETDGRLAQLVCREHRGAATPLHVHTDTDETFFVVSGSLELVVGDERMTAGEGDYVFAPRGIPHAFCVTSETATFFVTVAGAGTVGPEGAGIEGFFREVAPLVEPGAAPPTPAVPDAEIFARRMDVYGIELVGPPPF